MKIFLLFFFFCPLACFCIENNKSLSYKEVISKYKALDSLYEEGKLMAYGKTDHGESLHLFIISREKQFDPAELHKNNKCILFINNGIHAGEPDGIDASVDLATDLLSDKNYSSLLENVVVCIVPVLNIDGAMQRNCCWRINQNGPDEYGTRANSKNLDLNRDFVKTDARNTSSLIKMIRKWDPDVFIDTHVSNGADYQYTMTYIPGQHNKLNQELGSFLKKDLIPVLEKKMKEKNDEIVPYVNTLEPAYLPDSGIVAFLETPRYLGGYVSLFNAYTFISETHMLKPFSKRKESTYNFIFSIIELCDEYYEKIIATRKKAFEDDLKSQHFYYNWTNDKSKFETIQFNGYEASYIPSKVTTGMRLYYDREKPFKKEIRFFSSFYPKDTMLIPKYFLIPQQYENIIRLLELSDVVYERITMDSTSKAVVKFIEHFETVSQPFEGRYLHYNTSTRSEKQHVKIKSGDYLIPFPQKNMRFALEILVPEAVDSYFNWGFFDAWLQQKEYFSDYVFEDDAEKLLKEDSLLKQKFDHWKKKNPTAGEFSQLNYIYQNSPYFEKGYRRYPILSIY